MADHACYTHQRKPKRVWNFATVEDTSRFIELVKEHPELLARISQERLLPKWEQLIRVTGVSANEMATKWKRLCDKYRAELRREITSKPGEFQSNWFHYKAMEFARTVVEKRIRLNRKAQSAEPTIQTVRIKLEPGTPPSSPPKPPVPVVRMPRKPKSSQSMIIKPPIVHNRPAQRQIDKKFIPIETFMYGQQAPVRCRKQDIKEDLQQQAGRLVASRNQPVHRVPISNLTATNMRNAPDNDYEFLMLRIYPILSIIPLHMKLFCYENMQHFLTNQYRNVMQARLENPSKPGDHTLYNPGDHTLYNL